MSKQNIMPSSGKIAIPGRKDEFLDVKDISTTPGGTMFGTTPGGTRIVYDINSLLKLQNSPLSRSPPPNMSFIPGITQPKQSNIEFNFNSKTNTPKKEGLLFEMEDDN
eukprot:TRINITY_DN893_c0_g1_i1.p1 TRINITY_DN893_c0_g1~~TRINITY_DN893_c0_g1_i1.p1  ORF type:complete len:108 (+),score=29.95 TRINITY_DN893_c0_g1_i1:82-405(+)